MRKILYPSSPIAGTVWKMRGRPFPIAGTVWTRREPPFPMEETVGKCKGCPSQRIIQKNGIAGKVVDEDRLMMSGKAQ